MEEKNVKNVSRCFDCRVRLTGFLLGALALLFLENSALAINALNRARFTEVVNQVEVIPANNSPKKQAQVGSLFQVPEILQTGSRSRAELVAEDKTVTRVGANTIFSFQSQDRTIQLKRGSLLFHAPKGRGGGTIQTAAATAAVLGTTIIVTTTDDGGFKCLVLEGQGEVRLPNGFHQKVNAGELVFIRPGSKKISKPLPYDLSQQVENSLLVQGFSRPLLSLNKISHAIDVQRQNFPYLAYDSPASFVANLQHQKDYALVDPNSRVHLNPTLPQTESPKPEPPTTLPPSTRKNPPRLPPPIPG
ncbi:MAG: cupin domain-containing protein [Verrucomicrobiae bacterium]|nr:cupin domain-containing protein [Verrucomicrobiae bacterium]